MHWSKSFLFDHLVGSDEKRRRYGEAERLRDVDIDANQEFCRLLDGDVGRFRALWI
jgi:hypothetical protein